MAKFYYIQIKLGKITIDNVPQRWKDEVVKLLNISTNNSAESEG